MRQQNFVICEPMFTNFFAFNVKLIVVENTIFLLSISLSISEICAISLNLFENLRTVNLG